MLECTPQNNDKDSIKSLYRWVSELDDPNQPLELRLHGQITRELVGHWPTSPEKGLLASFVATDSSPFLLRVKSYEDEYLQVGASFEVLIIPSLKIYSFHHLEMLVIVKRKRKKCFKSNKFKRDCRTLLTNVYLVTDCQHANVKFNEHIV